MGDYKYNSRPDQSQGQSRPLVADKAPSCGAMTIKDQRTVIASPRDCQKTINFHFAQGFVLHQNIQIGGNEIILIFRKQ